MFLPVPTRCRVFPGRYDNHDGSPPPDIAALIVEEEAALAADPDAAKPDKHCQWYE